MDMETKTVLAFLLAAPIAVATARTRTLGRGVPSRRGYTDRRLRTSAFGEEPIRIIVQDASVILRGVVRTEEEKRRAERIAQSVFGVLWVVNDLRVAPIQPNRTDASCRQDSSRTSLSAGGPPGDRNAPPAISTGN